MFFHIGNFKEKDEIVPKVFTGANVKIFIDGKEIAICKDLKFAEFGNNESVVSNDHILPDLTLESLKSAAAKFKKEETDNGDIKLDEKGDIKLDEKGDIKLDLVECNLAKVMADQYLQNFVGEALETEDLSAIMKNVTFDDKHLNLVNFDSGSTEDKSARKVPNVLVQNIEKDLFEGYGCDNSLVADNQEHGEFNIEILEEAMEKCLENSGEPDEMYLPGLCGLKPLIKFDMDSLKTEVEGNELRASINAIVPIPIKFMPFSIRVDDISTRQMIHVGNFKDI